MAHLIAMRQRIKAVETIKKVTHAMCLISMSMHSRLRNKKELLDDYEKKIITLSSSIKNDFSIESFVSENLESEEQTEKQKKIIILVGSQKSLCGNFNNNLFLYFKNHKPTELTNIDIIAIGKEAILYCLENKISMTKSYDDFSVTNFIIISNEISFLLREYKTSPVSTTIYYNYPKSFFIQEPKKTTLESLDHSNIKANKEDRETDYIWEHSPEEIYSYTMKLMIKVSIQKILFSSLLAEQSARFIAMDNATRNADKILERMRIDYNKLRQSQITKELLTITNSL